LNDIVVFINNKIIEINYNYYINKNKHTLVEEWVDSSQYKNKKSGKQVNERLEKN
jgi:hypothetical protein